MKRPSCALAGAGADVVGAEARSFLRRWHIFIITAMGVVSLCVSFMAVSGVEESLSLLRRQAPQVESAARTGTDHVTVDAAEHLKLSPVSTREHDLPAETAHCKRLSPFGCNDAKFRVFLWQKGGGRQFTDFLVHYLQALTYDEIVILANEDYADDGTDLLSSNPLYNSTVSRGMHFWQCPGDMINQGKFLTEAITEYKINTDFIFPTDADEYLAIKIPADDNDTSSVPKLIWDRDSFLAYLEQLPPPDGRPYKTLDAKPIPADCGSGIVPATFEKVHVARHCAIPGIQAPKLNCADKNIIAGEDFHNLDNGNHRGSKTHWDWGQICRDGRLEEVYHVTNLVAVHYQALDFSDWLIHTLRRAIDYKDGQDCNNPNPRWPTYHVCNIYAKGKEANFSIDAMRKIYREMICVREPEMDISGMTTLSCPSLS